MNISSIQQASTQLASQKTANQLQVETVKLSNNQIKAQGEAVLQLLNSVPQPTATVGNNINIKV